MTSRSAPRPAATVAGRKAMPRPPRTRLITAVKSAASNGTSRSRPGGAEGRSAAEGGARGAREKGNTKPAHDKFDPAGKAPAPDRAPPVEAGRGERPVGDGAV